MANKMGFIRKFFRKAKRSYSIPAKVRREEDKRHKKMKQILGESKI